MVKLATSKMDECRRRVQNEMLGHRRRKDDPLWKARRLMTIADERLSEEGRVKRTGLLKAGDPRGEVATAFHAKEAVRELYAHNDPELALEFVEALADDMDDQEQPIRSAPWAAPSSAGDSRSPPGTPVTSLTARPKR